MQGHGDAGSWRLCGPSPEPIATRTVSPSPEGDDGWPVGDVLETDAAGRVYRIDSVTGDRIRMDEDGLDVADS